MNIIAKVKQGDINSFELVFYQYHQKLYFYILSKTNSAYMADEAVQITFIKFWDHRENLNENLTVSCQLFRIAKTTLIDLLRKANNIHDLQTRAESAMQSRPQADEANNLLDEKDLQTRLHRALEHIPRARRRVFEMSRMQGKSHKEIATELSLSVKTVEHHIANTIRQLKGILSYFPVWPVIAGWFFL